MRGPGSCLLPHPCMPQTGTEGVRPEMFIVLT